MSGYRGYASPYDQAPQYHQQQRHEYGPSSYDREREREHREREIQLEISVDPNAFRRYYNHHLQQLGFNSKPIITNLTMIASQHLGRMSSIVAQCLEDHLRTVSAGFTFFYFLFWFE